MRQSPPGCHGQYLRIDLTSRQTAVCPIPTGALRRFIGGAGLGTWLLLQESADPVDALAAEAPLIFVFSPLVGSPLTTSAKFSVVAKSPLTHRINDSLSSSAFAIAGKRTGYDAIVVTGAADRPTLLTIDEDCVNFLPAGELWGRTSAETEAVLSQDLEPGYQTAAIGPAGEQRVAFATISHDGRHAGRGGLGAVMGSKRLKAICVRGEKRTRLAHPAAVIRLSRELSRRSLGPETGKYRELGTVSNLLTFNRLGTLPTRNFQTGTFPHAAELAPEAMAAPDTRTRKSCAACTIGCEHLFPRSDSDAPVRMEYENLFALGPLCGISDPDIVLRASALCDELGLDTISAGGTIAFAMECAERGLIDAPTLQFGNGEALLGMLRSIAARDGLGDLLADGSRAAAEEIGQGSADFAPHVKGLELPGYEPRALQTMALGLAVGTRGADHNRSGAYQADFSEEVDRLHGGPGTARAAIATENEAAIMDSLILCKFLRGIFEDRFAAMAEMLQLVTGWDVTAAELQRSAERIITAKKWYNIRQGWTPEEDTLPRRFLSEELPEGTSRGAVLPAARLQSLIVEYNRLRGWTAEGWIPPARLQELEIVHPDNRPKPAGVRGV